MKVYTGLVASLRSARLPGKRKRRMNRAYQERYQQDTKKILVNLNDRSASTYKLLLGRNWLSGSYLVDVDQ